MKPFSRALRSQKTTTLRWQPNARKRFRSPMKILCFVLLAFLLAGCGKSGEDGSRKIRFYQCPMHPWIKSDHPGLCTICGMALVPAYEGEKDLEATDASLHLPESTIQVLHVAAEPVVRGKLTKTLRLAGVLDDDAGRHRVVSAYFSGRIEKPFIEQVGEEVREGQPLAEIYSPELLYAVREFQRAKAGNDRSVYEVAARRLIQFGLTPDQVTRIATQSPNQYGIDILSPITGTVIKRYVDAGQYVQTGDRLFELGDFSKMWFHATIYDSDLSWIHLGQEASIRTPAAPGENFPGVVTLIDPNFDPATRSTTVRIEVPNPLLRTSHGERRALPHQAFAEADLPVTSGEGLLVPRSAILDTGRRAIVYVEQGGGRFERREVRVAARGDDRALVSSGLAEGERVVTNGNLLMDAESQMKDSGGDSALEVSEAPHPHAPAPTAPKPMDPFLVAIADLGAALAADDLAQFNEGTASLHGKLPELPAEASQEARDALGRLDAARHLRGDYATLAEARAAFLVPSEAAAALLFALKESGPVEGSVFACPMTDSAFPGAPAKARWIQVSKPLRNPWFGSAMLDCGAEIKPGATP